MALDFPQTPSDGGPANSFWGAIHQSQSPYAPLTAPLRHSHRYPTVIYSDYYGDHGDRILAELPPNMQDFMQALSRRRGTVTIHLGNYR